MRYALAALLVLSATPALAVDTPEYTAWRIVSDAKAEIGTDKQRLSEQRQDCPKPVMLRSYGSLMRIDGTLQGYTNRSERFPPYMQRSVLRAVELLSDNAGALRLELADGYLRGGCLDEADELYRFVLTNFSSSTFTGLRSRAIVGIDDVRAARTAQSAATR